MVLPFHGVEREIPVMFAGHHEAKSANALRKGGDANIWTLPIPLSLSSSISSHTLSGSVILVKRKGTEIGSTTEEKKRLVDQGWGTLVSADESVCPRGTSLSLSNNCDKESRP